MPILTDNGASTFEVSMTLGGWVVNFISTLVGLFISLFLLISHDDLQSSFIEPVELSNNLNTVRMTIYSDPLKFRSTFLLITYVPAFCSCSALTLPPGI